MAATLAERTQADTWRAFSSTATLFIFALVAAFLLLENGVIGIALAVIVVVFALRYFVAAEPSYERRADTVGF